MKDKLTLLFLCFLILGMAQDGCQESRLAKIQTGEIILNPNDLGSAGANKNYYESLSRGAFAASDYLGYAVAIAGLETQCGQAAYSLIVDIVEPQKENTMLKIVVDFRNQDQTVLTTWTKVKLSYMVTSAQRYVTGVTPSTSYIWATSQYYDISLKGSVNSAIFNEDIFSGLGQGCGLIFDTTAKKYVFNTLCDTGSQIDSVVANDVAIHAYIMGFQYVPDTAAVQKYLAVEIIFQQAAGTPYMTDGKNNQVVYTAGSRDAINGIPSTGIYGVGFTYNSLTNNGPIFNIANQNSELKGVKVAIVMSVINPINPNTGRSNGFGATTLSYSYSGIYHRVDPTKFNLKSIIDTTVDSNYDNLHEQLPAVKYAIYGFSSFALADGSGCTSYSMDVSFDTVNSLTVMNNQKAYVVNVVVQADMYFPQTIGVCAPGVQFTNLKIQAVTVPDLLSPYKKVNFDTTAAGLLNKAYSNDPTNLRYIKTRLSQKYETIPSSNEDQWIQQLGDNPLKLGFTVNSKADTSQYVRMNAEVVMNGLVAGKSYGIHAVFVPQATPSPGTSFPDSVLGYPNATYTFSVTVNGFNLFTKTKTGTSLTTMDTGNLFEQEPYGINVVGTTATFVYNVTVPRDSSLNGKVQRYQILLDLFEFQQVYDPATQCCVSQCPAQAGLDVTVTPVACLACDVSKGLSYDPATSLCKCADGYYYNTQLSSICFPCQTKLCATCSATKPGACTSCIAGASLNTFDSTCGCSEGFYENNGTCLNCASKCLTCSVASTCNVCADTNRDSNNNCTCIAGFYDAGKDKCVTCNPSCATCSSATSCTSCDARKFRVLNNTLCVCQNGYFELVFENGTKVCTKCSTECFTCSQSAIECSGCDASINRIEGYDSLGHRTCICKAGYHAVSDGGCVQSNCKSDKYCSQCQADLALCVQCQANINRVIKLPEHICVCADGFYEATDGTCKSCSDGCAKCSSATKCDACVAQATTNGDGTCKCASGTFFGASSNGVRYCQQCIQYCDKCSAGLTCQTCKSGYVLSVDNTCICPKNNFINAKGECVPCKVGCETCFTNSTCDKCISPLVLENNNCQQKCSSGFFLSGAKCIGCPNNCVGCTSNNQCYYCKDSFYLQGGACYSACPAGTVANKDTFQCVACNAPCKTCTNHPSSCTSCQPGQGYLQITGTDQKCVKQCAEGTFPQDGVCQVCDFRCAKCLGASGNCIACPAGRYLYNAACWDYCPGIVNSDGKCVSQCPPGYWRVSDQQCKPCSSECKTCSSNTTCLTCANDYLSLNGKCVKDCGAGYYTFRGMCVACDKSCKACANNPTQCSSCADGYLSSNGRCVSSCAAGTYLDTVSKTCRQCASTCATCSSQQYCLTCPNNLIVPVGGQCLSCIYPCASCSADLSVCNACLSGYSLSNGDCVRSCPSGTRSVNGVCSCASGLFMDGACVASCPSGYTKSGSSCQRCQSPCTQCSSSTSFCTDCLDSYTLKPSTGSCEQNSACNYGQIEDSGKCVRICDTGLYYQNGACIFGGCPSGFKDNGFGGCVSSTVATGRCESPTFKLNSACTDNCGSGFFPNINTRTCDSCSTNCQSCLSSAYCLTCATGFTSVDGKCVAQSKCSATQYSYNSACVASCPSGTYTSNGRCVRSCAAGGFYFGGWCYNTCPTEAQYYTDNACVASCPTGTTLVDSVCATVV